MKDEIDTLLLDVNLIKIRQAIQAVAHISCTIRCVPLNEYKEINYLLKKWEEDTFQLLLKIDSEDAI